MFVNVNYKNKRNILSNKYIIEFFIIGIFKYGKLFVNKC